MSRDETSARAVVDANSYMALGTADENGTPWVSPVWFAHSGYREFFWVSSPDAKHSRNIAARPEVSLVIFDSTLRPGATEAVYVSATAELVPADDVSRSIEVYSRKSESEGLPRWSHDDVSESAKHRLYRAVASDHSVLDGGDHRVPVDPT